MVRINNLSLIFIFMALNCLFVEPKAQNKIVGVVTDSISGEALPFISIYLKGTTFGTMTDNSGKFTLNVPLTARHFSASSIGYKEKIIPIREYKHSNLKIQLSPLSYDISGVVVKPKKRKYQKKGNPAVEFVKKVIASKDQHNPLLKAYYQYEVDENITIALNNFQKEKNKALLRKYGFLINYVDTSKVSDKPFLPISTREKVEDYYYRNSPRIEKRTIIAKRNSGLDQILPQEGVDQVLSEVFKDVDIYDNIITLLLKHFVSPLSSGAPDFYKFYLMDTVVIAGERCADLGFVPFTSQSPGFTGHLYITLDSTYFVKKVKLNFPKDINLNFVQDMSIDQQFNRAPDGTRLLIMDDIIAEFSVLSFSSGFYARRTSLYSHHSFEPPSEPAVFNEKEKIIELASATLRPDSFWKKNPMDTLGKSVGSMMDSLRKDPFYYYSEKVLQALLTGYIETASPVNKITLGPIYSTLSSNTVEGIRLRLGGLTTANLNDRWFAKGYLAYGTVDRKLKYLAELEYSFDKKKKQANEFPVHSLRLSTHYELNRVGQFFSTAADNILLSLKRQPDDKITYQRSYELSYNKEFYSQLSYGLDLIARTEFAAPTMPFVENVTLSNVRSFSLGEVQFRLRYAPGEKIFQSPGKRYSITRDAPVFTLSHTLSVKGVAGSGYDLSHTEIGFQKRFWFSSFGNANVIVKAGKVWTKDPFPLLIVPNANLSYTLQYESYSTMNVLEFVNDQYLSWDLNYNMNGLILNRIPLIQALKLREILSFRGMYGSLNNRNDPAFSNGLFEFPAGAYRMGKMPFMEAGVGVDNIFKVLRIDYVWRMSYLNHPNIDKNGIRFILDFAF